MFDLWVVFFDLYRPPVPFKDLFPSDVSSFVSPRKLSQEELHDLRKYLRSCDISKVNENCIGIESFSLMILHC